VCVCVCVCVCAHVRVCLALCFAMDQMADTPSPCIEDVDWYHSTSSHQNPSKFAQGGSMDWSQQPAKFLRFRGSPMLDLPLVVERSVPAEQSRAGTSLLHPSLGDVFSHEGAQAAPESLSVCSGEGAATQWLGQLLQDAFGLTAWKGQGSALWSLRANASGGALQPLEAYILADAQAVPQWQGAGAVLFHYNPFWHALEVLSDIPAELWAGLRQHLPPGGILIAVTSIYWRNAWKYGDPGFRYVHQDIGHYLGALGFASAVAGSRMTLLEGVSDDDIARLVGLRTGPGNADDEQAQALVAVSPPGSAAVDAIAFTMAGLPSVPFRNRAGRAERTGSKLSRTNGRGHRACRKPCAIAPDSGLWRRAPAFPPPTPCGSPAALRRCIAVRRSAHEWEVGRDLELGQLLRVLRALLPDAAPFDALPFSRPLVPLLILFVHRVCGLAPGLYALCRDTSRLDWVKACAPRHRWRTVDAAMAEGVPLFDLQPEDVRDTAKALSCQQEGASQGCVAFAMFMEYKPLLSEFGTWMYRRGHWEAGMIGQALYINAEAIGCSGTAMGCFFGPWTHEVLGIDAERLQDVEHFTLGFSVVDQRVQTVPPYAHLRRFRMLADRDAVDTTHEDKAVVDLQQTTRGNCRGCSRKDVEGRPGTDDHAGQFYCGRCWADFDPKARAGDEADARELAAEGAAVVGLSDPEPPAFYELVD